MALHISNTKLLTQYAEIFIPLMSYICFKFFSLSPIIKLIIAAGISENPIPITKTIKEPLCAFALFRSFIDVGYGFVEKLNLKLEFPVACLRIDS